jgi:hypothetical protein
MMRMAALASMAFALVAWAGQEERTHTGKIETERFTIRYRPGSRAGAAAERWARVAERFWTRISEQLEFEPKEKFSLYLYDSVSELQSITGATSGGHSVPLTSHVPYDNEQTAYHELVHVFAERFPKAGEEKRNLFSAEGLSNALLVHVNDIHVHAQARYYKDVEKLPSLGEMLGAADFYAWMRKTAGFNAYDVAGSFFRYLLDAFGAEKVRKYYTGMPAKKAFGKDVEALEKGWHTALARYETPPEMRNLIERNHGGGEAFTHFETDPFERLPPEVRGKDSDWTALSAAKPSGDDAKLWKRADGVFTGTGEGNRWVACDLGKKAYRDCALAALVEIEGSQVQVRLGEGCQAMYVANGTFVYSGARRRQQRRVPQPGSRQRAPDPGPPRQRGDGLRGRRGGPALQRRRRGGAARDRSVRRDGAFHRCEGARAGLTRAAARRPLGGELRRSAHGGCTASSSGRCGYTAGGRPSTSRRQRDGRSAPR